MPATLQHSAHKSHSSSMSKHKTSKARSTAAPSTRWSVDIDMSNVVSVQKILRMKCKPSTTIMEIKKKLRKTVGYPLEYQRLYVKDFVEVKNHLRVIDLDGGLHCEDDDMRTEHIKLPMLTFHIRPPVSSSVDLGTICFYGTPPKSKTLFVLMMEAQAGLAQRFRPEIQMGGSAGTYVMRNQFKDRIACFKPYDEEPRAPNNPRPEYIGLLGDVGLREGIRSGQGCLREVAAFAIDTKHYHNVPYTCLCEASDDAFNYGGGKRVPKLGSFQQFIEHDTCMSDYSSSSLDADEVHKIGLLDIRIMNVDRNDGNVLVSFVNGSSGRTSACSENGDGHSRRDSDERHAVLVPIDHGYCLPDKIHVDPLDWCWYYWKQAKKPFSSATVKYIHSIDVDADAEMLRQELKIDLPSLRVIRVSGRLMKIGVAKGLTLFEMAEMIAREEVTEPSRLELTVMEAMDWCKTRRSDEASSNALVMLKPHADDENLCNDIELLNLHSVDLEESGSEICLSVSPFRFHSNNNEYASDSPVGTLSPHGHIDPPVKLTAAAPVGVRKGPVQRKILTVGDDAYECGRSVGNDIKHVESEEDINSIRRITPDEISSNECFNGSVQESNISNAEVGIKTCSTNTTCSTTAFTSSSFDDSIWGDPLFEREFYKTVAVLIERDVQAVLDARPRGGLRGQENESQT